MRRLAYLLPLGLLAGCVSFSTETTAAAAWFLPVLILGFLSLTLTIYALYRLYHAPYNGTYKVIWLLIILLVQTLGAILYLLLADRFYNGERRA